MTDPGSCLVAVADASADAPPPGLEQPPERCGLRFIPDRESLAREAPDADIAYVWQPQRNIRSLWSPPFVPTCTRRCACNTSAGGSTGKRLRWPAAKS